MEHRTELEQILLDGLPEQERQKSMESMQRTTAKKLAHLQWQADVSDKINPTETGRADDPAVA
jgi:hypothetical protein